MKRAACTCVLSFLGLTPLALAQDGVPFDPGCPLPFAGQPAAIDADCGIEGASATSAKKRESRTKNNFCAPAPATLVTFVSFRRLHEATRAAAFELGADRSGAKDLHTTSEGKVVGEGTRAVLAGHILRADIANKSNGEAVNCNRGGAARNDVHVHVARSKSTSAENFCRAVVAEISPHSRPDDWSPGNLMLVSADGRPVRITGHLFFDGNHPVKCDMVKPANSRASTWEIHPVYRIDVCKKKSLSNCDPRQDGDWKTLKEWLDEQEDDDPPG